MVRRLKTGTNGAYFLIPKMKMIERKEETAIFERGEWKRFTSREDFTKKTENEARRRKPLGNHLELLKAGYQALALLPAWLSFKGFV